MNDTFRNTEVPNHPAAVKWFRIYCGVSCAFYLCLVPVSWSFFLNPPKDMTRSEADFFGLLFLAAGLLSFALFVLPFCVAPRPWVWVYGLVLICFGLTSAACLPVAVPLLIFWMKPEVKRYYGRI